MTLTGSLFDFLGKEHSIAVTSTKFVGNTAASNLSAMVRSSN